MRVTAGFYGLPALLVAGLAQADFYVKRFYQKGPLRLAHLHAIQCEMKLTIGAKYVC